MIDINKGVLNAMQNIVNKTQVEAIRFMFGKDGLEQTKSESGEIVLGWATDDESGNLIDINSVSDYDIVRMYALCMSLNNDGEQ